MLDTSTKLQLLAERFKSKSEYMYINSINEALSSVIAKLAKTEGQSEIKRLNSIKRFIEEEIGTLYESIKPTLAEDMQGFAKVQHEVMFNGLNAETGAGYAFGVLPKETIKEIINMDSITLMNKKGYTLNEMFATASNAQIDRYKQIVSAGLAENAGYSAITKRLKDANAVGTTTLQAIVHTAVSSARDKANVNVYKKFDKYIDYFESTAVLDSRTSFICASLDGKKYRMPYNEIPSRPPRHPRCRSVLTPRSDSFKTNTTRQQNGDSKGQISSNVKFPEWFSKQSPQFQLDYLGKARYDLYKSGKMEFKQFVDVKSGKLFTLDEISGMMKPTAVKVPKISFGYDGKFDGYVADIRDEAKIVIDKLPKPKNIEIVKGSSTYSKGSTSLGIGEKQRDSFTFLHEYGHHIDSVNMAEVTRIRKDGSKSIEYKTKDQKSWATFKETLIKDKDTFKLSKQIAEEHRTSELSDIFDAMYDGALHDKYKFHGHGKKYFSKEGAKESETFANLFAIWSKNGKEWEESKKYFPNTVLEFEKIMKDVIDGKFN